MLIEICLFQALSLIRARRAKEAVEKMEREKELLRVTISKDDVDLIVSIYFIIYIFFANITKFNVSLHTGYWY